MKRALAAAVAAGITLLWAAPALAHVTVQPSEALAGGFQAFTIQVPNERDDASTIRVEVQFPPLASVSFLDVPGWNRQVKEVEFDQPIEAFGQEVTGGVGSVVLSGGEIAPGEFMTFGFSAGPLPEEELEFRAIQTYDSGEVVRWVGAADSDEPAPRVQTFALGEEGEGQLEVIADLQEELEESNDHMAEMMQSTSAEPEDEESLIESAVGAGVLGALALLVAIVALVMALRSGGGSSS